MELRRSPRFTNNEANPYNPDIRRRSPRFTNNEDNLPSFTVFDRDEEDENEEDEFDEEDGFEFENEGEEDENEEDEFDEEDGFGQDYKPSSNRCSLEDKMLVDSIMDDLKLDYLNQGDENLKDFYKTIFSETSRNSSSFKKLIGSRTKIDFENISLADPTLMFMYTDLQTEITKYVYVIMNPFKEWIGNIKRVDDIFTFRQSRAIQPWMLDTECVKKCEDLETMYYEKNIEMIEAMSLKNVSAKVVNDLLMETIMLGRSYIQCRKDCRSEIDKEGVVASAAKAIQTITRFNQISMSTSFWLVSSFSYYYMYQSYLMTFYLGNIGQMHESVLEYLSNTNIITNLYNKGKKLNQSQMSSVIYNFMTQTFSIESDIFALYYQTFGSYSGVAGVELTSSQIDFIRNQMMATVEINRQITPDSVDQINPGVMGWIGTQVRKALFRVEEGGEMITGRQDRVIFNGFFRRYIERIENFTIGSKTRALFTATTLFSQYLSYKNLNVLMGCINGNLASKLQIVIAAAGQMINYGYGHLDSLVSYVSSSLILYFLSIFIFYIGKHLITNENKSTKQILYDASKETVWKSIPTVTNLVNMGEDMVQLLYVGGKRGVVSLNDSRKKINYCGMYDGKKLELCNKCVNDFNLKDPESIERCIQRIIKTSSVQDMSYKQIIEACRKKGFKGAQLSYCILQLKRNKQYFGSVRKGSKKTRNRKRSNRKRPNRRSKKKTRRQ